MKSIKKITALLLALALGFSFSACSIKDKTVYFETSAGRNTVFKIGDLKCSKKEALVYLLNAKNIYGTVEDKNLWAADFNTEIITGSLKDAVLEHLTRVYVLDTYAKENEIELSDKEKEECIQAADEYYLQLNEDELAFTGVKKKDIEVMYSRYALAEKVYAQLMGSVDEEVSEDEARVMEAYALFVDDKAKADEIKDMIDYGYTFERLAATYTQLDTYQVTFARNEYPQEVDTVVFNLDTDEISDAIEVENGYYFFQCLDKYNEKLSEENKEVIIEARRAQVLNDIVSDLEDRYYSNMNVELWDKLGFADVDTENLTNASFFEILSKHVKY